MADEDVSTRANKRLIAVLLLTTSRPGPKLVFHYPSNLHLTSAEGINGFGSDSDDGSESGAGNGEPPSGSKEEAVNPFQNAKAGIRNAGDTAADTGSILGFSEDSLEKLLSPSCWCDHKKFEICLDGLTFLGQPMFADRDGSWAHRHTHMSQSWTSKADNVKPVEPAKSASESMDHNGDESPSQHLGIPIREIRASAKPAHDFQHVPESLDSHPSQSIGASLNSASSTSTPTPEPLTSFSAIFVLRASKADEYGQETSAIYHHVVRKLSKALYYCQRQTSYIGLESKRLLTLKAKAKQDGAGSSEICRQMLESSGLAWALKQVYENISVGSIAGIRLNGMEMSLQIPPAHDKQATSQKTALDRHTTILLLEDKETLLRELAAHPDASPLAYFIREHTPGKSLRKQAFTLGVPINDVLYLAQHLVKWQKACAILPLHPRNIYIVGRDAPLNKLSSYAAEYSQRFSALPSLPQVLKVLSGRPIKYGMLIPSRDHRAPYMDILAYLVQHKFVEQLKTSGWLQAPVGGAKRLERASHDSEPNKNRRPLSVTSLLSPQLRPVGDDDAVSVSSERTAIPLSIAETMKKRGSGSRPSTSSGAQESVTGNTPKFKIIPDALPQSPESAEQVNHILESVDDEELTERMPGLLQYFNGEAAFEEIAAREGLKRSKLDAWLDLLQDQGFLLTYRHL